MEFGMQISCGGLLIDIMGSWKEELPDYPGRFFFRGDGDQPVSINGCCMHVCAMEVHREDIQQPTNKELEEELDALWRIHQPDGGFATSTIKDQDGKEREVVIYITPYGD